MYVHVCVCCCVHTHTVCCNVEDSVLRVIRAAPPSIKVITFPKPGNFTDIIITFLSFSRSFSLSLSLSFTLSLSLSRTSAYGIYPKIFRNSDCVRYKYRGEIIAANTVLQNLRISPLSLSLFFSFLFLSFFLLFPFLLSRIADGKETSQAIQRLESDLKIVLAQGAGRNFKESRFTVVLHCALTV